MAAFMYSLYDQLRCFKFNQKYQQMPPVVLDYLSASYDHGARNLDEYFNFDSIAGQNFKMKETYT